jgi:hypothetical protein
VTAVETVLGLTLWLLVAVPCAVFIALLWREPPPPPVTDRMVSMPVWARRV